MSKPSLFDIGKTFFKLGITCWGGPAIVAQIQKEVVDKKKWISDEEFKTSLGFCQMFPGPLAVQTSAHLGYRLKGVAGSITAFATYIFPTFAFMLLFSFIYFKYQKVPSFIKLFKYLDAVIVAILIDAIWSMRKITEQNFNAMLLIVLAFACFMLNISVVLVLFLAGLCGVIFFRKGESAKGFSIPPLKLVLKRERFPLVFLFLMIFSFVFLLNYYPQLGELGLRMAKVNLLAFGGGYTAVALMFQESVLLTKWLTEKEFINGLVLGQITPGPVTITATFIGYKIGGFQGAIIATLSVLLPSYLIILFLLPFFNEISSFPFLKSFTSGLICAFMGMLFQLLVHLSLEGIINIFSIVIIIVSVVMLRFKISPIYLVFFSLVLSYLL